MAYGAAPVADWVTERIDPGSIVAKFTPETTPEQINAIAAEAGLSVNQSYGNLGNLVSLSIVPGADFQPAASSIAKAAALWNNAAVVYAEPNAIVAELARVPNDPLYNTQAAIPPALPIEGQQWALHNTGQTILPFNNNNPAFGYSGTAGVDIDAETAWNASTGSKNTIVAVIDSGVDYFHPDLKANLWQNLNDPPDGIDNDNNGYVDDFRGWNTVGNNSDVYDDNGHGTHVAGIIGAVGNNGIGIAGVNWNVTMLPIKATNPGSVNISLAGALGAYNYVLALKSKGVDISVINYSAAPSVGQASWSFAEQDSIQTLTNMGILFVASAGNSNPVNNLGSNTDVNPTYPGSYNLPNIISVGSSDALDRPSFFTNYGPATVDLMAPGTDILSTVPSWFANGFTIVQGTGADRARYAYASGTSMASSMVSGAAALIKSLRPDFTASQIRDVLLSSAEPVAAFDGLVKTGGRLNIGAAVNALPHASVNGFVYQDANGDGVRNTGETGIAGAVVYVDANNNGKLDSGEASATSAADGSYSLSSFSGTGVKTIRQVPLTNFVQTAGASGFSLNLQIPSTFNNINFGNRGTPSQVTGQIVVDSNRNGALDAGESGAGQITVFADYNGDGRLGIGEPSTKSDAAGNYRLLVSPGTYTIRLSTTPGWQPAIVDPTDPLALGKRTGVVVNSTQTTPNIDFFVVPALDWGDSPDSYNYRAGTTIYEPPSHGIMPNFYIGQQNSAVAGADAEPGPQISTTASGDNALGVNDEPDSDIQFLDELKPNATVRVQVKTTTGNNPQGLLQGWIDFNRDGVFSADEKVVNNLRVGNGTYTPTFKVPSTFTVGVTFARFRLGYENNLGPTGPALAGEVVDKEVRVFGPTPLANDDGPFPVDQNSAETTAANTFNVLANDVQSLTGLPQIAFTGTLPNVTYLVGSTPSTLGNMTTKQGGQLFYYDNGTPADRTDDQIRYRPPVGKFGPDEFYYQVTDGNGHLGNVARVAIQILPANPIARDDTFTVPGNAVSPSDPIYPLLTPPTTPPLPTGVVIDVLGNDLARGEFATGGPNVTIVGTPAIPAALGTLTKVAKGAAGNTYGHDILVYNRGSVVGPVSFEFTYQMNDSVNPVPLAQAPTATVTMQVLGASQDSHVVPANAQVRVRAEVQKYDSASLADPNAVPRIPIDTAGAGQTVMVGIYVQDLRRPEDPNFSGVINVGVDLLYDPVFATSQLKTDPGTGKTVVDITYGPGFSDPTGANLTDPFIIAPGLVDEITATFIGNTAPIDGKEQLFATLLFTVNSPPPGTTTHFVVNPADDKPDHSIFVYDANPSTGTPVELQNSDVYFTGIYTDLNPGDPPTAAQDRSDLTIATSLVAMGEGEYTNKVVAQDVNNDQKVDIQDAITVIKSTRTLGAQTLQPVGFQAALNAKAPTAFVDVNHDGLMNMLDAVAVIRYLRSPPTRPSNLEGGTGSFATVNTSPSGGSGEGESVSSTAADYLFATDSFSPKKTYSSDAIVNGEAEDA